MPREDFTDEEIFDKFGVGTGDFAMRAFIHGQRNVNGLLYKAIDSLVDCLKKSSPDDPDLLEAWRLTELVPGEPPACNSKAGGGGGTG